MKFMQILLEPIMQTIATVVPSLNYASPSEEVFELLDRDLSPGPAQQSGGCFGLRWRMGPQAKRLQEFEWRKRFAVLRKPPAKLQSKISVWPVTTELRSYHAGPEPIWTIRFCNNCSPAVFSNSTRWSRPFLMGLSNSCARPSASPQRWASGQQHVPV